VNALSPVLADDANLARRFLAWSAGAFPHERAEAVNALARAYLYSELDPGARAEAEIALTQALDDPEPLVRRALAEAFASARAAPRALVLALASDLSEVAKPVLAHSPLLSEADLVDCAGYGDAAAQRAIARRAHVGAPVAAAIAEIGERPAVLALIGNLGAKLGPSTLWRILERFSGDAALRERLAERPGLPAAFRAALAAAATADLSSLAAEAAWLGPRRAERIGRDGREHAFVAIAASAADDEIAELVAWLRGAEHLTVGLLLRALACGDTRLIAHALADFSGLPPARAAALLSDPHGQGFAALYARADMPAHLLPAFRIAVDFAGGAGGAGVGVNHALTQKMIAAIEALRDPALTPVVAMLWRLAAEGARADAREFVALAVAPPQPAPDEAPVEIDCAPPVLLLNVEPSNENFAPPVELDIAVPEPVVVAA
jgi:uncharacterized protein (DUF2336 family)